MRLLLLLGVVALATSLHVPTTPRSDPCQGVYCRAGRECVVSGGEGQCLCVISCPEHDKPVCGDDGISYDNFCLLHQRACLSGEHIAVDYVGYCKADIAEALRIFGINSTSTHGPLVYPATTTTSRPATTMQHHDRELSVCYGPQRDSLRDSVISTWQRELSQVSWYTPQMTYLQSLLGHFYTCDQDRDHLLRPDELLKCFEKIDFHERPEQDKIVTKTLCIDAMVEAMDSNKDWKLNYQEFVSLLNPMTHMLGKNCSLEDKTYTDGAEITVKCNHCVCATGSWVCAPQDCDEKPADKDDLATDSSNRSKDIFGYMDSIKDLESDNLLVDDYDEDYEDYEDDGSYRAEQAEREFNLLSDTDKKAVIDLENKIQTFYRKIHTDTSTPLSLTTVPTTTTTTSSPNEYPSSEQDLIEREDHIVERYDELLQRSRQIRQKLQGLRTSLSELEREKENRHHMHTVNHHHANINQVDSRHDNSVVSERRRIERKHKKYRAYRESLARTQDHNREVSEIDNDIWEDQWKAKVGKHHHDGLTNHVER